MPDSKPTREKSLTHEKRLVQGEVLFREGDHGHEAYIVESGEIAVTSGDGARHFADLGSGALLGEMAILDDSPRTATATALSDCRLTVVTRDQIIERLASADPILRLLLSVVVKRLRSVVSSVPSDQLPKSPRLGPEMRHQDEQEAVDKMRLESELRSALDPDDPSHGEIVVAYQPIVHLPSGDWAGFEALVRWQHPDRGLVSPAAFIDLAEETGLILPLGRTVLRHACEDMREFNRRRGAGESKSEPLFMGVNVSGRQLGDKAFLETLKAVDPAHARYLKLEITESLVVDYERARVWIEQLKACGYNISMDDFGTGYSGFQQLLELDFDFIKIDQMFVLNMLTSERSRNLIAGIVSLTRNLGLKVVAEGVEEAEMADALSSLGVHFGQGWHFARPMMRDAVLERLESL